MGDINEKLIIDAKIVASQIVNWIRNYKQKYNVNKAVIGVSGGVDSATTLILTVKALGKENVKALIMPSRFTRQEDVEDALKIVKKIGVQHKIYNISQIEESFQNVVPLKDKVAYGNRLARIRMTILYSVSNEENRIVVGTGNKSEILTGYFTKYGDGGVDILPLGDLYKTEVWQLASYLKVPEEIVKKKPSAGLWPGQSDEEELGLDYRTLDAILHSYVDLKYDIRQLYGKFGKPKVDKVLELIMKSEHKRRLPLYPTLRKF